MAAMQLEAVSAGALHLSTTLACVAITAVADGLAQGALYAEAATLPPQHTQVCPVLVGCILWMQ